MENRLVVAQGEGGRGGKDWEFEISRCKLVHILRGRPYYIAQGATFNILG